MSAIANLLREDLRDFAGYRSARSDNVQGDVWLNANEASSRNGVDIHGGLRRYPEPQPRALCIALAALYGCAEDQLLVGRGSDEAIDLLVRAFCTPGRDTVLVTPPVFGMYAVCARLHGARVCEVPLRDDEDDFQIDLDEVARMASVQRARLVFLCAPGNPAGGIVPATQLLALARQLEGRALLIVDEAYIEFADAPSLVTHVAAQPNLAILRTLSKAHALAAVRIGCLIANPDVITALRRCQAPYPIPAPCADLVLRALSAQVVAQTTSSISGLRTQRESLRDALTQVPSVRRVYPSQANFLLARFADAQAAYQRLLDAGVVVRDMRVLPQLGDALRITVGTDRENTRLIAALRPAS